MGGDAATDDEPDLPQTRWATPSDIEGTWRPLNPAETVRAANLIGTVERAIARTWPTTADRITAGTLDKASVVDVIVWSVLPLLEVTTTPTGPEIPSRATSYQSTSGTEGRTVTLDGSPHASFLTFAGWMVDVFESSPAGVAVVVPQPRLGQVRGGIDRLFPLWDPRRRWENGYDDGYPR
ncbi:hypothetical protein [Curtobacterium sp. MCBD17_028]|uniref:hypothetical protein n=1 Tax=Curtobacterium sp. MCBD17_028 TaxID=2175670 RepID=UPI000DA824BB|nr:hypothetical protein [Curtobacterium sp. MCBD17_028]PZE23860.1 hypothetical protein DEI86_13525 [Curtobacterium sp. MCBD17_028]